MAILHRYAIVFLKVWLDFRLLSSCQVKSFSISFIIFAGTPPTTQLSGTSFVTTAPAATTTLLPIVTPGKIVQLPPIQTSFPIFTGFAMPRYSRLPLGDSGWFTVVIKEQIRYAHRSASGSWQDLRGRESLRRGRLHIHHDRRFLTLF